jgi:hypothetical protein
VKEFLIHEVLTAVLAVEFFQLEMLERHARLQKIRG